MTRSLETFSSCGTSQSLGFVNRACKPSSTNTSTESENKSHLKTHQLYIVYDTAGVNDTAPPVERSTPGEEVLVSILAVVARSLLVRSVSV